MACAHTRQTKKTQQGKFDTRKHTGKIGLSKHRQQQEKARALFLFSLPLSCSPSLSLSPSLSPVHAGHVVHRQRVARKVERRRWHGRALARRERDKDVVAARVRCEVALVVRAGRVVQAVPRLFCVSVCAHVFVFVFVRVSVCACACVRVRASERKRALPALLAAFDRSNATIKSALHKDGGTHVCMLV